MNQTARIGAYGVVTEPTTLTIQRLLPGPVERIWAYLTDGDLRKQWLAGGEMMTQEGAPFEFVWRNDELSDEPADRPSGAGEEHRMQSCVIECDAQRKLSFTWQGSGNVTFQLEPKGEDVLLTVIHRRLPDRASLLNHAAGWHQHLDTLVARANGRKTEAFWPGWKRLHSEYDSRVPA